MRKLARILAALALIGFIGLIVWHDWLREERAAPEPFPAAAPQIEPEPREIVGIGAMLKRDEQTGALVIMGVLPNSPAAQAGLTAGWIVHTINDQEIEAMSLEQCVSLIRGPAGTKLRLRCSDLAQTVTNTVELTRARVILPQQPEF